MKRSPQLTAFLEGLNQHQPDFESVDFTNINATNSEGENALHAAIIQNAYEVAEELILLGIEVNARGDLGNTPLHEAALQGKMKFVRLLVDHGADLFALNEGSPPFTLARVSGHHEICNYLGEKMEAQQQNDPSITLRSRIEALELEIRRLKARL